MDKKTLIKLIIGYLVMVGLLIMLFLRKILIIKNSPSATNSDELFQGLFILIFFITIFFILIGIGTFVYKDSKKRGMNPMLWTLIALFVPYFVGIIIYLLARKPIPQLCPNCGKTIEGKEEIVFCPHCGFKLNEVCSNCKKVVKSGAKFCPYCGTSLNQIEK